jgi:hypothetical protein
LGASVRPISFVGCDSPVGRERLEIARASRVDSRPLDHPPDLLSEVKRLALPAGSVESDKAVDREGLSVEVLAPIGRRAIRGRRPKHSARNRINQIFGDEAIGELSRAQKRRI